MDYGKFKYDSSKRERERRKKQHIVELKEVKFRPDIAQHDFDVKIKKVRGFLEDNNKVKLVVQFKGRQMAHPETGRSLLERVCATVEDVGNAPVQTGMEGKHMSVVLVPKK